MAEPGEDYPQPILPPPAELSPAAPPIQSPSAPLGESPTNPRQSILWAAVAVLLIVAGAGWPYSLYLRRVSKSQPPVAEHDKGAAAEPAPALENDSETAAVAGQTRSEPTQPVEPMAETDVPNATRPASNPPSGTVPTKKSKPKGKSKKKSAAKTPAASSPSQKSETLSTTSGTPAASGAAPVTNEDERFFQAIEELYRHNKLLAKDEYPQVRAFFAARFARQHEAQIRKGLGADYEAMQEWFSDHPDAREELFIAIRPEEDKIVEVLRLFNGLRKQFPDKFLPYASLAIATAVVWDDPKTGVYSYGGRAKKAKASLPQRMLGGVENFRYLVAAESQMQGRIQYLPWEFLVHVVNHRTPEPEREWAMQNYLGRRVMFGRCYSDVPYDVTMLKSDNRVARLNGQQYTLPDLLLHGGVCANQADFAARVGKSIGVPAAYVAGPGENAEMHAWVMWVELKQATPAGLACSLESYGRYRFDHYYVGTLADPQTGKQISDRDLELRLQTAGLDPIANRHTNLVMKIYPQLCEHLNLSATKRLALLSQVINYSPGCEEAWLAVGKIAREVSGHEEYGKVVAAVCDRLFTTFARVPDFTWKVFDDLAAYEPDIGRRTALYERLATMYETASRPDLACTARLQIADMLVEQGKPALAVESLSLTIKRFPTEGRYVPTMLDKVEKVCQDSPGAEQKLIQCYVEVLPLVPPMRGDEPSPYALMMFQRAADVFARYNQPQLAQMALAEREKIMASRKLGN